MAFLGYIKAMCPRFLAHLGLHLLPVNVLGAGLRLSLGVLILFWGVGSRGTMVLSAETPISKEYQIKAAFIYNFTKFVEWPPASFPEAKSPIVIGVLGINPFGNELQKTVENRRVNGRELVIRLVTASAELEAVHVLFISTSEAGRFPELLKPLRNHPVLTIAEKESFIKEGGMIAFLFDEDKVRFAVNVDAAETAGLKVSAQLQKLAASVRKKP